MSVIRQRCVRDRGIVFDRCRIGEDRLSEDRSEGARRARRGRAIRWTIRTHSAPDGYPTARYPSGSTTADGGGRHMSFEPVQHAGREVDVSGERPHTVAFLWVDRETRLHPVVQERLVELPRLSGWSAPIEPARDVEARRTDLARLEHGAAQVRLVAGCLGGGVEEQLVEIRDVAGEVLAVPVGDGETGTDAAQRWSCVVSQLDMKPPYEPPVRPMRSGSAMPRAIIASTPEVKSRVSAPPISPNTSCANSWPRPELPRGFGLRTAYPRETNSGVVA